MLLLLAGSLVAVSLPGCAGSSGGKSAPRQVAVRTRDASPTLGIVAGKRITKHDVDSVLAYAPPAIRESYMKDPEQFQVLVERIVQQEMLYLAAKKDGLEADPAYQSEVAAQTRQILLKHYYTHVTKSLPPVSDAAIQTYYEEHAKDLSMPGRARVRHIQVATQAKGREVVRQLKSGTWDQVCAKYSTDRATAKSGGVLGFVTTDAELVPGVGKAPAIVAAAFRLKEGETSEPLKSEKKWHVIRVEERTEAGVQPLVNVRQQIKETLEGQQSEKFQTALLDSLKRAYGVVVYADSVEAAMTPVYSPAQLFARAQASPSPKERIRLFQEVTRKYPDDKSAVQAAFMVGFTYAEELRDFPAARTSFEEFLKKYPKSDLVTSAKWMLENMEHSAPPPEVGVPDTLLLVPGGPEDHPGTNTKP